MEASQVEQSSPLLTIVACSYEGLAFGWDAFREAEDEQQGLALQMAFGFNLAGGPAKCCAISQSGRYLVVGATDERIRMFHLDNRTALGELNPHNGSITALKFFRDSHMISASDDHTLCIWRTHDWACLHVLGGHKDSVHDVAIHPSGKLAISVSKDRTLRTWDLVNGRCAYITRLKAPSPPDRVGWSPMGRFYYVILGTQVQVHDTTTDEKDLVLNFNLRVNQVVMVPTGETAEDAAQEDVMIVLGGDDGVFRFYAINGELLRESNCKELLGGRVKDFTLVDVQEEGDERKTLLVSASSVGGIHIWDFQRLRESEDPSEALIHAQRTKGEPRLTCVAAWSATTAPQRVKPSNNRKKRPRQGAGGVDEHDEPSKQDDDDDDDERDGNEENGKEAEEQRHFEEPAGGKKARAKAKRLIQQKLKEKQQRKQEKKQEQKQQQQQQQQRQQQGQQQGQQQKRHKHGEGKPTPKKARK